MPGSKSSSPPPPHHHHSERPEHLSGTQAATRPDPLRGDAGTFVGTVGPVFKNPAVASAVAARATDELFTELNLQTRLRDALPPKASFAAVPITNATKGYVTGALAKVLTSPQFQAVWIAALTVTHRQLVAVLHGQKTPVLSTSRRLHRPQHRPPHQPGPGAGVRPGL